LSAILGVLKIPFQKKVASDQIVQVQNIPLVLNALCQLLKFEMPMESDDDVPVITQYEKICGDIT